jgi:hypothetical protein
MTMSDTTTTIIDWLYQAVETSDEDGYLVHPALQYVYQTREFSFGTDGYRMHLYRGNLTIPHAQQDDAAKWIKKAEKLVKMAEKLPHVTTISKGAILAHLYDHVSSYMDYACIDFHPTTFADMNLNEHLVDKPLFRLNADYLKAAIEPMGDAITVRFGAWNDPVIWTCGQIVALVMPVSLR